MSEERDLTEQAAEIITAAGWYSHGDAQWTNLRDALPKLRELFPVRAKPLAWAVNEFDPLERIAGEYSVDLCGPLLFWACWRGMNLNRFESSAEAKAACEAHNQARFLEMVA